MATRRRSLPSPLVLILLALMVAFPIAGSGSAAAQDGTGTGDSIAVNGGFEEGTTTPDAWYTSAWRPEAEFMLDRNVAHGGTASARIDATNVSNDAAWLQDLTVVPNQLYELSGWIRTEDVAGGQGANLGIWGTWDHTEPILATSDWTRVSLLFNSGAQDQLTIAARLGYWGGDTTGVAWFDDIELRPIPAPPQDAPVPGWKILVLIYPDTDVTLTDSAGQTRHVVATMTPDEIEAAVNRSTLFLTEDIPALTSRMMVPEPTVKVVDRTLATLTPVGAGFDASRADTAPELDPAFDSIIVIWDPRGTDVDTGERYWLGAAAGLTYPRGTRQGYNTIIAEAAVEYPHRNVFRHEWGHQILFFYEALGVTPEPTVNNHPQVEYVHCGTGEGYIWEDETVDNPIPNSIYNVDSGFTHDYYSGETAESTNIDHCLGVTREAWSHGGPVTRSVPEPPPEPEPTTCNGLAVTVDIGNGDRPTSADDVILGTSGNDTIRGGNGDDTICGLGGDDRIAGGNGKDWIHGGDGDDVVHGGNGKDHVDGGADDDRVLGHNGADTVIGGDGRDVIIGGLGKDRLLAADGHVDRVLGDRRGNGDHCQVDPVDQVVGCRR